MPAAAETEAEFEAEIEAESQISPILNTVLALKFAVHFQKYSVSTGKFDFEFVFVNMPAGKTPGETQHLLLNGCIKVNETFQAHQAMPGDEEEVFATSIRGRLTSEAVLYIIRGFLIGLGT